MTDAIYDKHRRFRDDAVPRELGAALDIDIVEIPMELDGGAILSNGQGLCLVSERVVHENETRGAASRADVIAALKRLYGADQVVFLAPLTDEPTGHLDCFATFVSPDTIVIGRHGDWDQANAALLDEHALQLAKLRTAAGSLNVVRIPMPIPGPGSIRGTYTNVVYANGVLLVPSWPGPKHLEEEALEVYRRLLPRWRIVTIDCRELGSRGGALHCATLSLFRKE